MREGVFVEHSIVTFASRPYEVRVLKVEDTMFYPEGVKQEIRYEKRLHIDLWLMELKINWIGGWEWDDQRDGQANV